MFPFLLEGYQIDENQPVSYVMRGSEGSATGGDGSGQGSPHLPGNTSPMHGGNASFSSYPSAGSGSPDPRHEHPGGSYSPEMLGGEGGESRKRPYSRTSSTDSLEVKPLVLLSSFYQNVQGWLFFTSNNTVLTPSSKMQRYVLLVQQSKSLSLSHYCPQNKTINN